MAGWGVTDRRTARRAGIEWPDQDGRASYDDIWTWQDVHVKFAEQLEQSHPTEAALINATRASHSDGLAAYLSYMAVRLLEMQGKLLADSPSDLPDLGQMQRAAADLYARRYAEMSRREA